MEAWVGTMLGLATVCVQQFAQKEDRMSRLIGRVGFAAVLVVALSPRGAPEIAVLAPIVEGAHGAVLAFLADGEAWSSSALAIALAASPRTVQRALDSLAGEGKVQSLGRGRARRWMSPPLPGFPTILLLPGPLPSD